MSDNPYAVSDSSYGDRDRGLVDESGVEVSARSITLLEETRPWVRLMGILLWIGTVIGALGTVAVIIGGIATGEAIMIGVAGGYLLFTFIYGYLAKALTDYASRITTVASTERVSDLESAIESQKNFWRSVGLLTVVFFILYLGIVIIAWGFGFFSIA